MNLARYRCLVILALAPSGPAVAGDALIENGKRHYQDHCANGHAKDGMLAYLTSIQPQE